MKNGLLIGAGVVVALAGLIFSLQGFNAMAGSVMSGSSTWKVLGPIIAVVGLIILATGLRSRRLAAR
jgi:uncharacterized membrane protein YqgA involved in biofilm formation